jgi:hypothetical protein
MERFVGLTGFLKFEALMDGYFDGAGRHDREEIVSRFLQFAGTARVMEKRGSREVKRALSA